MAKIVLHNNRGQVYSQDKVMHKLLWDKCSFRVMGAEHSEMYKKGHWDGYKRLYHKNGKFSIGLWHRIKDLLDTNDYFYEIDDRRTQIRANNDVELDPQVELRDYQLDCVRVAIAARQSILQVATGGGKTLIAGGVMASLKCPTIFIVHTRDLLYQAKSDYEKDLNCKVGQIGDGVIDYDAPVVVATMQTLSRILGVKYESYEFGEDDDSESPIDLNKETKQTLVEWVKSIDLIVWDEVHRVACNTAYEVLDKIPNAPYRLGLSASPWRDDGADLLIEAAFGSTSAVISATQLINQGFLVPPIIKRIFVPPMVHWAVDTRNWHSLYKQEIVENESRNQLIVDEVSRFIELEQPCLILVKQIKHGKILKRMITEQVHPIDFISGRDGSDIRSRAIQDMRDGTIGVLIASTIADEGLNMKNLSALIMAGGGKSSTRALQRVGRALRIYDNKTHASIVDFNDGAKYLRTHAEKRKRILSSEPGFIILELDGGELLWESQNTQ